MKKYLHILFATILLGCNNFNTSNKKYDGMELTFPDNLFRLYDTVSLSDYMKDNSYKILAIINGGCDCSLSFLQEFNAFISETKNWKKLKNCIVVQGHSFIAFDNLMIRRNMYKNLAFFKDTAGIFLKSNSIKYEENSVYLLNRDNIVIFWGYPFDNMLAVKKVNQLLK